MLISARAPGDYLHRGVARYAKGDLDGAIANYDRAIAQRLRVASSVNDQSDASSVKGISEGGDRQPRPQFRDYSPRRRLLESGLLSKC